MDEFVLFGDFLENKRWTPVSRLLTQRCTSCERGHSASSVTEPETDVLGAYCILIYVDEELQMRALL